ncbi:17799_t:CDS:2, partial [Entrophospora sp. SA101]
IKEFTANVKKIEYDVLSFSQKDCIIDLCLDLPEDFFKNAIYFEIFNYLFKNDNYFLRCG